MPLERISNQMERLREDLHTLDLKLLSTAHITRADLAALTARVGRLERAVYGKRKPPSLANLASEAKPYLQIAGIGLLWALLGPQEAAEAIRSWIAR